MAFITDFWSISLTHKKAWEATLRKYFLLLLCKYNTLYLFTWKTYGVDRILTSSFNSTLLKNWQQMSWHGMTFISLQIEWDSCVLGGEKKTKWMGGNSRNCLLLLCGRIQPLCLRKSRMLWSHFPWGEKCLNWWWNRRPTTIRLSWYCVRRTMRAILKPSPPFFEHITSKEGFPLQPGFQSCRPVKKTHCSCK